VLIWTDSLDTRCVRWLFGKHLHGLGVTVHTESAEPIRCDATNWWQKQKNPIAPQNENNKYAY
jgi:hypothetical protein